MSNQENQEGLLEDPRSAGSSGSMPVSGGTGDQVAYTDSTVVESQATSMDATGAGQDITFRAGDADQSATTSGFYETVPTAATDADYVVTTETTQAQPVQTTGVDDDDTMRVRRYEEELQAQKVEREAGTVRVNKDVIEEQQTLEVPVTREEVHIRSVSVNDPVTDTSDAFQGGAVEMTVREEDVQVSKQARVAEELEIEKRAVQETERVTETVRKEQVNVQEVGEVDVDRRSDNPLDETVRHRS